MFLTDTIQLRIGGVYFLENLLKMCTGHLVETKGLHHDGLDKKLIGKVFPSSMHGDHAVILGNHLCVYKILLAYTK